MSGGAGVFGSGGGGIDQALSNFLDPGNIFGGSASSNPVSNFLDPFETIGMNPTVTANNSAAGGGSSTIPNVLPNLGVASMVPQAPRGAFMAPATGKGQFNDMAAALAGPLFNPAASNPNAASWIPNANTGAGITGIPTGPNTAPGGGAGSQAIPPNLAARVNQGSSLGGMSAITAPLTGPNATITLPPTTPGGAPITIPLASILPQNAQQSAAATMPYYANLRQKV